VPTKGSKKSRRKTKPVNIRAAERRNQAIGLRKQGKTFKEIGAVIGVTPQAVFKMVTKTLDEANALLVTETKALRQRQLDRIDVLVQAMWKVATEKGEVGKVDRLVKLFEREAKLAGLDAAEKFEHSGPDGGPITVGEIRSDVAAKLAALAAQRRGHGPGG
jgi:hypothetical protein